jgi:pimeloyl-ACP methyl ester carboxylesterase
VWVDGRVHDSHPLPGTDVVVDGVRLHVIRHGRDGHAGEAVVLLLHGLGTTSRLWADVMRDLEHDHRSVAPDLAGCGRSERPPRQRCSPFAQAQLLIGLLDELGHDRAVVVGHDIGGMAAVHLAALAPERIHALVLVATPLHADAWPPPIALPLTLPVAARAYAAALHVGGEPTRRLVAALVGPTGTGAPPPEPELSAYIAALNAPDGPRGLRDVAASVDAPAATAALAMLTTAPPPTLVLWGEEDTRLTTAYGARVASELPGAVWVPVAGAGHLLPTERPERVAEEIAGFLAELPASTAADAALGG